MRTRWPATTAIAVVPQSYPIVVEATSDGWVVLTPVGGWGESPDGGALSHLQLTPSGVRRWTRIVREALAVSLDSTKKAVPVRIPQLGRGLARIAGGVLPRGPQLNLSFGRCDGARTLRWR